MPAPLLASGFVPMTEPKLVEEFTTSAIVLKWGLVNITSGLVSPRANGAVSAPIGVALGYAKSGEKVLVCIDPDMKYIATYTGLPIGFNASAASLHMTSTGNATAQAGSPHTCAAVLSGTPGAVTSTNPIQVLRPAKIPGSLYGDGTSSSSVSFPVECRIALGTLTMSAVS